MTDQPKRGRGRPKKVTTPVEEPNCIPLPPDYMEVKNIGILKEDGTVERLYPPDNLSKSEKLKWLTGKNYKNLKP